MTKEEISVVQVALDHLLEMQTDVFNEHIENSDEVYRATLTINDWDEMSTIARRIAVIKGLQYDVTGGKY
tara:strand:+ start:1299 stop:1508 length:210 start_codon:yes stop_codon:yes gene_type:complete